MSNKFKFPKSLASCVDRYFELRNLRLVEQKRVDAIEEEERALKEYLISEIPKSEASGIAGKLARATVVTKVQPTVEDWESFYKYVKRTGNFDLLQKRLSDIAIKERWESGKEVPGVGKFNVVTLSINKV